MEQEQTSTVQNKSLLITALALGVVVALVYNWHIGEVRRAGVGETVMLLVPRRTLQPGDKLDPKDLRVVNVETHFKEGLGANVISGTMPDELIGEELSRGVQRGRFLRWGDITGHQDMALSWVLRKGMESFTLKIETNESPGQMLRQGDRIAVIGTLDVGGKVKSYRIIEGVKVVSIGGLAVPEGANRGRTGSSVRTMRSYRSVGIQVDPETALQLHNVVPRVIGNLRVDVLSPKDKGLPDPEDPTKLKYEDPRPIHKDLKTIEPLDGSSGSSSGL